MAENPFKGGYSPEMDVSLVLGQNEAFHYQSLVGVMRWRIEIGCIYINTKVSLFSSHSAMSIWGAFGGALSYHGLPEAQA